MEEDVALNKKIAEDLYKQIRFLSLKDKTFIAGYLMEMLIDQKVFDHHGFKRLWNKYEKSKLR